MPGLGSRTLLYVIRSRNQGYMFRYPDAFLHSLTVQCILNNAYLKYTYDITYNEAMI